MSVRQPEIWSRNRPQQESQKASRLTPAQRQQIIEQEWKEDDKHGLDDEPTRG